MKRGSVLVIVLSFGIAMILTGLAISAAVQPSAEGEKDGDSPLPAILCGLALGAILIGVCVAGSKFWRDRRAASTEVRVATPAIRFGRGVVRRKDLAARILAGMFALFILVDWAIGDNPGRTTAAVAPPLTVFALLGWGEKLVVTSDSVVVHSLTRRVAVARSFIDRIQPHGIALLIILHNGVSVRIKVGMSEIWSKLGPDPRDYRAAQLKTMARLNALLEALPQTPTSEFRTVSPETRYLPTIMLIASVIVFLVVLLPRYVS